MDETFQLPDEPTDLKAAEHPAKRRLVKRIIHFARDNKRKTAATAAAAAFGIGAVAGFESRTPANQLPKADVPMQAYGKDGYPQPKLVASDTKDPIAEQIKLVPSDNPFEIAQQLLQLAANPNNDKVVLDQIWTGVIILPPGTVLYHAPVGSQHFMPSNPSNNGEAGKFVVSEDEVAVVRQPRILATYTSETPWIVATQATDKSTQNRATDISQNYWYSLDEAQAKQAKFMAYKQLPAATGSATVDNDGNLRFGTEPADKISVFETVKTADLSTFETANGLIPTTPPAGR